MDNFIYIGYRIDCVVGGELCDEIDRLSNLEDENFSINVLPGCDWMFWTHIKCHTMYPDNIISVFPMRGEFAGDYRCPIGQSEIYKSLFEDSIDTPVNYAEVCEKIRATKLFKKLSTMFNPKVTWGIFLGLG